MQRLLDDIYIHDDRRYNRLVFGNSRIVLGFDLSTGRWISLTTAGVAEEMLRPSEGLTALGVSVDGSPLTMALPGSETFAPCRLVGHTRYAEDGCVCVEFLFSRLARVTPLSEETRVVGSTVTMRYTLYPGSRRLERSILLSAAAEAPTPQRVDWFDFSLPGLSLGPVESCVINVPGPWWPDSYVRPDASYVSLLDSYLTFHSAPDAGFGLVAVTNVDCNLSLVAYMETNGESGYRPSLKGDGSRLTLSFRDRRAQLLEPGEVVVSGIQYLEIVDGGLPEVLASVRRTFASTFPATPDTPEWIRDIVLLEVMPSYFPEGFRGITERLPFYRDIGFNCLHLMPHWPGEYHGYHPHDPFRVNPDLGTPEDLKALVTEAHRLGIRVLFDLVIHGFSPQSPVAMERPELFLTDDDNALQRHADWGSLSTDWSSPEYHTYLAELARHDFREYGIDGYRVDAASFKNPGWHSRHAGAEVFQTGSASPLLLRNLREALRAENPEAVLLSEVFGPVFSSVCDLAHDNQTEAPQHFLEMLERGEATAEDYKRHMASVFALLPPGSNRVFFARNHDTSWFYRFGGYTPRFLALDAIHALCALPEVFAGDPMNGPSPDDAPAVWEYYRGLFTTKHRYPELSRGALDVQGVSSDNPLVFTALRHLQNRYVLIAVSLSDGLESALVTLPFATEFQAARDAITGENTEVVHSVLGARTTVTVNLPPCQSRVILLTGSPEQKVFPFGK